MTVRLLESVPNFSEGRDAAVVRDIVDAMRGAGADVLDWTADPDHHRSVVTVVGAPAAVENAAVAAARVALERIDLQRHQGVHPRIGAIDVLPFVPVSGLTMAEAVMSARRVGARIAEEVGIPVFFYAHASTPPGRTLAELRRGGWEALVGEWPADREPDILPERWSHPGAHPTAGAVCVGARNVLLAWNVVVRGVTLDELKRIAGRLRESGGGIRGLRAIAVRLRLRAELQLSMNLEDVDQAEPMAVFRRIESEIAERGGEIVRTEVVGLVPDRLATSAAADRIRLEAGAEARLLSQRLFSHVAGTMSRLPE
ncbi:MAG: glutamate formimidoyltransferase [Gemmatimonadetes bacterium]|nr:glutamate formimidoyltransferase [Gemmatimonadota bacterium]